MKSGKLNWDDLKSIIDKNKSVEREEVRVRTAIGEDCAVISFGSEECVISTDPITGASKGLGKLAVHINCNDIASSGVEPLGIMVTILAPEGATLEDINEVMQEISTECKKLNVEILGGHTEVTAAVNKLIVSCTVLGKAEAGGAVSTSGAKIGDDIIVTKDLCLEGMSILANDYAERAKEVLTEAEINKAKSYTEKLSVVKEGVLCGKFKVHSMHDVTEGGLLGALWETAEAANLGFEIFENKLPINSICKKLCNAFKIDPLRFISSGTMLITTDRGEALVKLLEENNIKATIIGKVIEDKKIINNGHKAIEVLPPERDELFNIK